WRRWPSARERGASAFDGRSGAAVTATASATATVAQRQQSKRVRSPIVPRVQGPTGRDSMIKEVENSSQCGVRGVTAVPKSASGGFHGEDADAGGVVVHVVPPEQFGQPPV